MLRTCFAIVGTLVLAAAAQGQPTAVPGISATEIRIGNTMPYSGPASSLGLVGRVMAAYFQMVNDQGGVNGRPISFITLDDGFSPSKNGGADSPFSRQCRVYLRVPPFRNT
jgi:ABC-type branched-subunit amino acid transport system substrate-binding protein